MPNLGYMVVQFLHLLALSIWIGGTLAIGGLTAPAAFRSLPSRAQAGEFMGPIFRRFDRIKDACCIALVATSLLKFANWERNWNIWFATRYLAILMMVLTALVAGWVVGPSIRHLRATVPATGALPPDRAERFRTLHRASVVLMQIGLAAALVALLLS